MAVIKLGDPQVLQCGSHFVLMTPFSAHLEHLSKLGKREAQMLLNSKCLDICWFYTTSVE